MFHIVSNVLFDHAGHVVLGRAADGNLVVQPFMNSPKGGTAPRAKLVKTGPGVVIAAAWRRRVCHYATLDDDGLRIGITAGGFKPRLYRRPQHGIFPTSGTPKLPADLEPMLLPSRGVMFVDAAGELWSAPYEGPLEHVAGYVVKALSAPKLSTLLIQREPDGSWRAGVWEMNRLKDMYQRPEAGRQAFFGYGGLLIEDAANYLVALELKSSWLVIDKGTDHLLAPPAGFKVVGAVKTSLTRNMPALVCLDARRHAIVLVSRNNVIQQWSSAAAIVHVTVSAVRPHIAWVTEQGDLEIASLSSGQKLFRSAMDPGSTP